MLVNIKEHMLKFLPETHLAASDLQLPNVQIDTDQIKCIMINEVPPMNPYDDFYSDGDNPEYMRTTLDLFHNAGVDVTDIRDILGMGIYITTAVKMPKLQYEVPMEIIVEHMPLLEKEIDLFPNLKVIMLMGDVAKKSFNRIAKKKTKKSVIPSGSTYKIREYAYYYGEIRVFPSYIMTGGNILIEKSKRSMISDDIREMMEILQQGEKVIHEQKQ